MSEGKKPSESALKWIEAARQTLADFDAEIACPECGAKPMTIFHVPYDIDRFEHHLHCPACGAHNSIIGRMPSQDPRE